MFVTWKRLRPSLKVLNTALNQHTVDNEDCESIYLGQAFGAFRVIIINNFVNNPGEKVSTQ